MPRLDSLREDPYIPAAHVPRFTGSSRQIAATFFLVRANGTIKPGWPRLLGSRMGRPLVVSSRKGASGS
jgi:hypothetical protein